MGIYESRCPVCGGRIALPNLSAGNPYDFIIESLAEKVYNSRINKEQIPDDLYWKTAGDLLKSLTEGLGGSSFSFEDPRNSMLAYFQQNIFQFSAAKSTAELKHFNELLLDDAGKLRSFTEFRNACMDAGYTFNVNWLQTEYNTAVAGAQSALNWEHLQHSEVLEYSTVGDDKVRPAHAALEGFTAPPTDKIWNIIYPPNDWNCRCTVIPGLTENIGKMVMSAANAKSIIPLYFQRNTGTSRILLDDSAYLKYQPDTATPKELQAEKNYGMQSVEKIYERYSFEPKIELEDRHQAYQWYADTAGAHNAAVYTKDVTGVVIKFDSETVRHTVEDHIKENRFEIIANLPDILTAPDEIWSIRTKKGLDRYYIKYFADAPIVVYVSDGEGMNAYTMFEAKRNDKINVKGLENLRRGTLIYRKR